LPPASGPVASTAHRPLGSEERPKNRILTFQVLPRIAKMHQMKSLFLAISLLILPIAGHPSEIASVNFNSIKEALREYYFSKPDNSEIKESFETAVREEEEFHEEIQRRMAKGKGLADLEAAMSTSGRQGRYQIERRIDTHLRKELYLIIKELDLEYDLIYDASDTESTIYAKRPVDDLTALVRQAIIDRAKEVAPGQNEPESAKGEQALDEEE